MSSNLSKTSGIAGRYAGAFFELCLDRGEVERINTDLISFNECIRQSMDLRDFIRSPVYSADDQLKVITEIAKKAGFSELVSNFLCVVASNNRLFIIEAIITSWQAMLAAYRGETKAEVSSAAPLLDAQKNALEASLREALGSKVQIEESVDPSLLGGLVIRVGSKMIDSSLRTKLERLQLMMKGAA